MAPLGIPHHQPPPEVDKKNVSFQDFILGFQKRNYITTSGETAPWPVPICVLQAQQADNISMSEQLIQTICSWLEPGQKGVGGQILSMQSSPGFTGAWDPGFGGSFHKPSVLLSVEGKLVLVPPRWNKELKITLLHIGLG